MALYSNLSVHDENQIRDCIDKMEMIKQQTEDLNPQVSRSYIYSLLTLSQLR